MVKVVKKSLASRNKTVKQRNFESLTKAGQRVAIAQDVIDALMIDKLNVVENMYLYGSVPSAITRNVKADSPVSPSDATKLQASCSACALGSMFLAKIKLGNDVTWGDMDLNLYREVYPWGGTIFKKLKTYFSLQQLCLIESAFEQNELSSAYYYISDCPTVVSPNFREQLTKAVLFGNKFADPKDRMLAIMQNIVDHGGTFKPVVEYEIVKQ